jgi:hypothetical protein
MRFELNILGPVQATCEILVHDCPTTVQTVIPYLFRRLAEIQIENSSDPSLGRVEEVYLCDHCDQDFTSLTQLMVSEFSLHSLGL